MKKIYVTLAVALLFVSTGVIAQTKWNVDMAHSSIKFGVTHMLVSEVEGKFKLYSGNVVSATPDFANATINFTVDVNSINTDNEFRDRHLKGDDFFNAAQYPQMKFASKSFTKVSENKYKLTGDLTIRDITKQVTFDVTYGGSIKDGKDGLKAGFRASTTIDRFDYKLKWNKLMEAGGATVGKEVTIYVNLELNQAKS